MNKLDTYTLGMELIHIQGLTAFIDDLLWTSLVAQMVKHLSTMRETWVPSLGWEDPLEKGKAIHSSVLA